MNRLTFLRFLTGLGLLPSLKAWALVAPQRPDMNTRHSEKLLYGGFVRGLSYYEYDAAHRFLTKGSTLILKREPENPHDRYAIEVWFESQKLGYLPRAENKTLAHILDHGHDLRCEIRFVDRDPRNFWDGLYIKVFGSIFPENYPIPENRDFVYISDRIIESKGKSARFKATKIMMMFKTKCAGRLIKEVNYKQIPTLSRVWEFEPIVYSKWIRTINLPLMMGCLSIYTTEPSRFLSLFWWINLCPPLNSFEPCFFLEF